MRPSRVAPLALILLIAMNRTLLSQTTQKEPTVETLIETLNSDRADERLKAVRMLGRLGRKAEAATPVLLKLLKQDSNSTIRGWASMAVVRVTQDVDSILPALIEALGDNGITNLAVPVWKIVSSSLGKIGAPAVPHLIPRIHHEDLATRQHTLWALWQIGPPAELAVPDLIGGLKSEDRDTRWLSMLALGAIGPAAKAAVPALIEQLKNEDFNNQCVACRALGGIGPEAVPAVLELKQILRKGFASARSRAAAALGDIGPGVGEDVVDLLVETLNDQNQTVREEAVIALGKLAPISVSTVPAIQKALEDPNFNPRIQAARTLWQLTHDAGLAIPILLAEFNNLDLASEAAQLLGEIGPSARTAIPYLIDLLSSNNTLERATAAEALGRIGIAATTAVPALREAIEDEDETVRAKAVEALKKIGDTAPILESDR